MKKGKASRRSARSRYLGATLPSIRKPKERNNNNNNNSTGRVAVAGGDADAERRVPGAWQLSELPGGNELCFFHECHLP